MTALFLKTINSRKSKDGIKFKNRYISKSLDFDIVDHTDPILNPTRIDNITTTNNLPVTSLGNNNFSVNLNANSFSILQFKLT